MQRTLLIIEDDRPILDFLMGLFKDEGFIVEGVTSGSQGLRAVQERHPDLVILDLGLPDISGESVLSEMRKEFPQTPVIILTAKVGIPNIVEGLKLGADDYLEKPFDAQELLARVNARLRPVDNAHQPLRVDDVVINRQSREVSRAGKNIPLTKTEFDLLTYLMINKGSVLTREMILNHVWGYNSDVETRVVDVYIGYLRRKIEKGFKGKLIRNKRGVGYYLKK